MAIDMWRLAAGYRRWKHHSQFSPLCRLKRNTTIEISKDILNECLLHLSRRPLLYYLTHWIIHCLGLGHFADPWKGARFVTPPIPCKDQTYVPPVSCPLRAGYLEADFKNNPEIHRGRNLLYASEFDYPADRSTYTSMYAAGLSHHSTFHVDGCRVLWHRESLRHNMAPWPVSVRIV
jgi:hypothetical protein